MSNKKFVFVLLLVSVFSLSLITPVSSAKSVFFSNVLKGLKYTTSVVINKNNLEEDSDNARKSNNASSSSSYDPKLASVNKPEDSSVPEGATLSSGSFSGASVSSYHLGKEGAKLTRTEQTLNVFLSFITFVSVFYMGYVILQAFLNFGITILKLSAIPNNPKRRFELLMSTGTSLISIALLGSSQFFLGLIISSVLMK